MSRERARVAIDFFADLTCPWCYIGWETLKRAAAARRDAIAVSVSWRSFLLSADTPAEGVDRRGYLAQRFAPEQLRAAHAALEEAAREIGAPLNIDAATRIPNTVDAHRLVHWAAQDGQAETMIDALYAAYFVAGEDIGAGSVLVAKAAEAGLDPLDIAARLASDLDRQLIVDFHAAAERFGVQGVPVAIFNKRLPVMGAQSETTYGKALDAA
ncbi:MAG TPA: DsbA family oxidoreductase [Caulobacterales bacterium]|nr:DsbA family oxidoreductase [Caulobacterales bacterium]